MKPTNQPNRFSNQLTNKTKLTNSTAFKTILLFFLSSFLFLPSVVLALDFEGALKQVQITDSAGTNQPPTAVINFTQNGDTVDFDASGSTDSDGSITEYQWDFGDGAKGTGQTISHSYSAQGDIPVTLTVLDNNNAVSIVQQKLALGGCSETPILAIESQAGSTQLISHEYYTFVGGRYDGNGFSLCKVSFLMRTWVGVTITDTRKYEVRIYSMDGDNLGNLKSTSEAIWGSSLDTNITFRDFTFSPAIEVAPGDAIVLTELSQTADDNSFVRTYYSNQPSQDIHFRTWNKAGEKSFINPTLTPSIRLYNSTF